jgi:hypothetical protein
MSCSISNKVQTCYYTVKGESSVARFLVNSFKWEPFEEACGCARSAGCTRRYSRGHPFSRHSSPALPTPPEPTVHVSHDHGTASGCCTASFNQDITSSLRTSCSVRVVQRIHLKTQQLEMPTTRTNRVSRRRRITERRSYI